MLLGERRDNAPALLTTAQGRQGSQPAVSALRTSLCVEGAADTCWLGWLSSTSAAHVMDAFLPLPASQAASPSSSLDRMKGLKTGAQCSKWSYNWGFGLLLGFSKLLQPVTDSKGRLDEQPPHGWWTEPACRDADRSRELVLPGKCRHNLSYQRDLSNKGRQGRKRCSPSTWSRSWGNNFLTVLSNNSYVGYLTCCLNHGSMHSFLFSSHDPKGHPVPT